MPSWLNDVRKAGPVSIVVVVLVVLLITSPQVSSHQQAASVGPVTSQPVAGTSGGPGAGGASGGQSARTAASGGAAASSQSSGGGSAPGAATSGPGSSGSQPVVGTGPAASAHPVTGQAGLTGGASYQGVTSKTVLMGFTWQHQQCGNYTDSAVAAAYGVPQPDPQTSITSAIKYFEEFPNDAFKNLPPSLAKGVSAKNGYWGRHVVPIFADNGGPLCADKARATATQLAEQNKVFGTIQIPNDGTNEYIAPVMAQHHVIDIGAPGMTQQDYQQWEPYVYDITFSGSEVVDGWASYACRDLVGKMSTQTGDPTTAGQRRVFAIVYPDEPLSRQIAAEASADLARCGGSFTVKLAYSTDISQQAGIASNAIAQFRANHVTTVYMLTDPVFSATLTSASTAQQYYPEWSVSSYGFNDVAFVVEHFYDSQQQKNVSGASDLSSSTALPWNQTPQYLAWKKVNPNTEPPGDWNNWFLQIEVLYAGMVGAGPNLTPSTFRAGLAQLSPFPRPSLKDVYVGFGQWSGEDTGVHDFTLVKFDPSKQDTHDPGDGTGRPAYGDWVYPENGLRYFRTIDHPER